jgi:eukaryotic-like serine/threonine-protein kinase
VEDDADEGRPTEAMAIPPVHEEPQPVIIEEVRSAQFELTPGTDVGGYVIDGELGRGGMGVVYSAKHPVIGKRAAIKVLKPSLSNNPATIERFIQEARSVNAIGHPNIVDIFDFDVLPDGRRYLVMDLLEGESLRKRVKRGPLPVHEAAIVLDEVASALDAAHSKGFIHRDLKPDNVFLVAHPGRFDVKLLDFGLAKLMPNSALLPARAYRTATGAQLGTPDYMSPEQLRGEKNIDHRTDIYALGIVAFEMLTGKRPRRFADGSFDLSATPSAVVGAIASVPAELAQLVELLLASDPDERPSLVAVRAVIKRVRPSLPSLSVVGLDISKLAQGSSSNVHSFEMRASAVGARPVLPTPAAGSPSLPMPVIPVSMPPASVMPPTPTPVPTSDSNLIQKLAAISSTSGSISGIRQPGTGIPTTKMGVPPPPMSPTRSPKLKVKEPSGSRLWLIVGVVLALAAGVAIAIVIAT